MTGQGGSLGVGVTPKFAVVLDLAISSSGMSLTRLVGELEARGHHVSRATLGYWRSGRSEPQRAEALEALHDLEDILGRPRDELASALKPRRPRGRAAVQLRADRERSQSVHRHSARLDAILDELGLQISDTLERTELSYLVDYIGVGHPAVWSWRTHWLALADGVDGFPIIFHTLEDPGDVRVEAVTGCTVGRVVHDPVELLTVCAARFPKPLREGESIVTEIQIFPDKDDVTSRAQVTNAFCSGPVTLTVHFSDDVLPSDVVTYTSHGDEWPPDDIAPIAAYHGMFSRTIHGRPIRMGFAWDLDKFPIG